VERLGTFSIVAQRLKTMVKLHLHKTQHFATKKPKKACLGLFNLIVLHHFGKPSYAALASCCGSISELSPANQPGWAG
jgi:hypothetical protein